MTTSSPLLARKISAAAEARGLEALDAPVSGGDVGAREARLVIMVGGKAAARRRAAQRAFADQRIFGVSRARVGFVHGIDHFLGTGYGSWQSRIHTATTRTGYALFAMISFSGTGAPLAEVPTTCKHRARRVREARALTRGLAAPGRAP